MVRKDVYTETMYEAVKSVTAPRTLRQLEKGKPLENIIGSLLISKHQNIIDLLLSSEDPGHSKLCEILDAYVALGYYTDVIKLLTSKAIIVRNFSYQNFAETLVNRGTEENILDYAAYTDMTPDSFSYLNQLLLSLWKKGQFSLAGRIINKHVRADSVGIYTVLNDLKQKIQPSREISLNTINQICNLKANEQEKDWQHKEMQQTLAIYFVEELHEIGTEIEILKDVILTYQKAKKEEKIGGMSDRHNLDKKIRRYYLEKGEWNTAKEYIEATDEYGFHGHELNYYKIKYAIRTLDKNLHEEALTVYLADIDKKIEQARFKMENEPEVDSKGNEKVNYNYRNYFYSYTAEKYAELAMFEIVHASKEKAEKYLELMIENMEAIMISIPKEASKRERGHIKGRVKVPFKRGLKELFLERGLFHHLPKRNGWSNPIKDPEQRRKDREIFDGNRDSAKKENITAIEKSYLLGRSKKSKELKILLDSNKIEEAILSIKETVEYRSYRHNMEDGMLILDYSKESFHKLWNILSSPFFDRRNEEDRHDHESLVQFFMKGNALGVVKDSDWDAFISRYCGSSRHDNFGKRGLNENAIVSLVRYTIAVGNIERAWYIFERINKVSGTTNSEEKKQVLDICLSYFIIATTNHEKRDGKHLAFKDADIITEEGISEDEVIGYWETKTNLNSKKEEIYSQSLKNLQEMLLNSRSPTKTITMWCKELVKYNLRSHDQIKSELEIILNSTLGKTEKIRNKIILTLIELDISGIQDLIKEICEKDLPTKVQIFFFNKLIKKKYISGACGVFLKKSPGKNLPHLKKLLTLYQEDFDLVVNTVYKKIETDTNNFNRYNEQSGEYEIYGREWTDEEKEKYESLYYNEKKWQQTFELLEMNKKHKINIACALNNMDDILNHPKGIFFGYFAVAIKNEVKIEDSIIAKYPITNENFLDLMENDDVLLKFDKDNSFRQGGLTPWSKAWFLENPKRINYLKPETIKTFSKFGTIIGLGILEGIEDSSKLSNFYEYVFRNISPNNSRNSILQLGEVFNLIFKKGEYELFDDLVDREIPIGKVFKDFVTAYSISEKGKTILTLMIAREINLGFQIFENNSKICVVDNISIKEMLILVYEKFLKYKEIIDIYKNVPVKTSIGIEYEVTKSIAQGYFELTGNKYKNDIEILSEYSGISRGNDAVHEIATKPTDNPYLLLLELKLLEDLDFLDLNFKREEYKKGARGLHVTVGGEFGITVDSRAHFIQNILLASNLGGLNAGEDIKDVNRQSNLRSKEYECETVFGENETACAEYRCFSIDKSEPFERLILSVFNLNMAKQATGKYLGGLLGYNNYPQFEKFQDAELHKKYQASMTFEEFVNNVNKDFLSEGPELDDKRVYMIMYEFIKIINNVVNIIADHNVHFEMNETFELQSGSGMEKLLLLLTSTGPIVQIMELASVDIYYLKDLVKDGINEEDQFYSRLLSDGKDINILTSRQKKILYLEYHLKIKADLEDIKKENLELFNSIGKYLNGNTFDTIRKITNSKRFKEVIGKDKTYLNDININPKLIFENINADMMNKFSWINNLFIKKDSANALSMFDSTREKDGNIILDSRLTETMIFDKIDRGFKTRKGYNVIQGASEKMLTQAIQKAILEFNDNITECLVI